MRSLRAGSASSAQHIASRQGPLVQIVVSDANSFAVSNANSNALSAVQRGAPQAPVNECCIIPLMPPGFGTLAGLRVGHAQDADTRTGCTVLLAVQGAVAAALVLGGAAGERELQTLYPSHLVERIDALLFAGGSAFGLDAAGGVMRWCAEHEIGDR